MSLQIDGSREVAGSEQLAFTLAITGGGTGGHVYPALAIAAALRGLSPDARVIYVGSRGGMEGDLVQRAGLPFAEVASGAIRGRGPLAVAASLGKLGSGALQSLAVLRRHKVRAVLATGGYVSAPVVVAAWLARIPSAIYLPDVEPGLAVRFLSTFARGVAVTCEQSRQFLPAHKVAVTGYPLRQELVSAPDRAAARAMLNLPAAERVLLVLGGSRGSHSINAAVAAALPELLAQTIVLHSCGAQDEAWLRDRAALLPAEQRPRYDLWPYLYEELPAAMAAADLAVSRAGASVMGEYPALALPSVLVPYPYAGAHQEHNADYLVARGAALKLRDGDLGALQVTIADLLANQPRLESMRAAARALARPEAAQIIAGELLKLCSKG